MDCSSEGPYDAAKVLLSAALSDNDLNCIYFVLRREPDAVANLLASATATAGTVGDSSNIEDDGGGSHNSDNQKDGASATATSNTKKRKREERIR